MVMCRKIMSTQYQYQYKHQQHYQQQQRQQHWHWQRQQFFQKKWRMKESCKSFVVWWQHKIVKLSLSFVLVIVAAATATAASGANLSPPPPQIPFVITAPTATAAATNANIGNNLAAKTTNAPVMQPPLLPLPPPSPLAPPPPPTSNPVPIFINSMNFEENFDDAAYVYHLHQQQQQHNKPDKNKQQQPPALVGLSAIEKEVVDCLIKEWAPVVWLAPEEKFMPIGVDEFLNHVHSIDKDRTLTKAMPTGDGSEKAYLVTNDEIDELLKNEDSFIYGRNPNESPVPIYAVVTLCKRTRTKLQQIKQQQQQPSSNLSTSSTRSPYIPVSFDIIEERNKTVRRSSRLYPTFKRVQQPNPNVVEKVLNLNEIKKNLAEEQRRSSAAPLFKHNNNSSGPIPTTSSTISTLGGNTIVEHEQRVNNFIANLADNVKFSEDNLNNVGINDFDSNSRESISKTMPYNNNARQDVPAFHVTYWMFYPYSQGKTLCTLNLGPLGHIPFPAVYGFCLGQRKDIGSHIGDWEHMSLFFNGAAEPDALYVSAHDAGAYYIFNRLTGSFEFKRQETRKGILQRPNFPKTVTKFNNHPVLFAAKGSHGLWTAPGKHRFVKVARLYDINGFGTLWNTWKSIQITYENIKTYGRSLLPNWLAFKGKWGNPKSNCHPFGRIGLNFCEYTDGPTGIPLKKSRFQCDLSYL